MKLYYHEGSWQLPGQQDKKAARVDVPGSPPELAAWLNSRRVPVAGDAFDGLVPLNAPAQELLDTFREGERPWELGPTTTEPPRYAPKFSADAEAHAEFIPVTKAAEIDRLLQRCPMCHNSEEAAQARRDSLDFDGVLAWLQDKATSFEIDNLSDMIEERRK